MVESWQLAAEIRQILAELKELNATLKLFLTSYKGALTLKEIENAIAPAKVTIQPKDDYFRSDEGEYGDVGDYNFRTRRLPDEG